MNIRILKRTAIWSVFFINLLVILYIWWSRSAALLGSVSGDLIAFGRLFGLTAEYCILVQLVLIGRIRVVEREYGFDNLNRLHRSLGIAILCLVVIHPILLSWGYAVLNNVSLLAQFLNFINHWEDVFYAFIGLLIIIGVVSISIAIVRKRLRYETWYFSHLLLYVAIYLVFGHQTKTADVSYGWPVYYWLTLNFIIFGLVLLYRFIRPIALFARHRFYIEKIEQETPTVSSVYVKGRMLDRFIFEAGQYANITFLDKKMWFTHPFSFSAAFNGNSLRFSIKSAGDYTSMIKSLKPGTKLVIDGPLGVFSKRMSTREKYLLVAAGIGITPLRALAEELSVFHKDTELVYVVRTESELAFIQELQKLPIKIHVFLSNEENPAFHAGRLTLEKIKELVSDSFDREIYVCGPVGFMNDIASALKAGEFPRKHLHYERFGY
jgi:predicted ferric reductase